MLNILVTAGATREPIDSVRFLSNVSSGGTGTAIAEALAERGHRITLLRGEGSVLSRHILDHEVFSSSADLEQRLRSRLQDGNYDAIIMSAAVADYRPDAIVPGKIRSDAEDLTLHLVRNTKILPQLKSFSSGPLVVIGFKLTVDANDETRRKAVLAQFSAGGVDAIVQNDLTEIRSTPVHPFRFYRNIESKPEKIHGTENLSATLIPFIECRIQAL